MMYPVGGVPPDGGVQETAMLFLPGNRKALRPEGRLGAVMHEKSDNLYRDHCIHATVALMRAILLCC